jgi:hypothetical protein
MGTIQSRLDGQTRVLAFAAFHVVLRVALALSAIGAGVAGDVLSEVRWPLVGTLESSRVVLLSAGLFVVLSSLLVRVPSDASSDTGDPSSEASP